jgi:hypothetical protein
MPVLVNLRVTFMGRIDYGHMDPMGPIFPSQLD